MQLIRLSFEIIDDFDFQEWTQAQAKLLQRPKNGLFRGSNTCKYLKIGIWYSHYLVFAKYCEYQIEGLLHVPKKF